MGMLAEAVAAQEFGKDAQGGIKWPTPGADAYAEMEALKASLTPAPRAAAPAAPATPVKPTKLTAEDVPEPPVVGQASPMDRGEIKKKTLLGA